MFTTINLGVTLIGLAALAGLFGGSGATDGMILREKIREVFTKTSETTITDASFLYEGVGVQSRARTFPNVNMKRNIVYGSKTDERMDLYTQATQESVKALPVIMMVHGGGWKRGDKAMRNTVDNKVKYFLPKGYAFISINYPMDEINPEEEVYSVGRALAYMQQNAKTLGIDPERITIMGHSAGAHLVALLTARTDVQISEGVKPWKATVALDGAMYDVVSRMTERHLPLFDDAFGTDKEFWKRVSPYEQYTTPGAPILFTCATQRKDDPCGQATRMVEKIKSVGGRGEVLPVDGGHSDANNLVGVEGVYTDGIQKFLSSVGMP